MTQVGLAKKINIVNKRVSAHFGSRLSRRHSCHCEQPSSFSNPCGRGIRTPIDSRGYRSH